MRGGVMAAALLAGLLGGAAQAAEPWPATTLKDLEAAKALIVQNHPAATPEMEDALFWRRLDDGYAVAWSAAAATTDFPAYVKVMRGFALSFQDPHIAWRPSPEMADKTPPMPPLAVGKAGFGVRAVPGGMWISMERLTDDVLPVVKEAQERRSEIQAAKRVIIDLRGNTGGNSEFGDQVAEVIVGKAAMRASDRIPRGGCGVVWRATPGNMETLRSYETRFAVSAPQLAREVGEAAGQMQHAMAQRRNFTADIPRACLEVGDDRPPSPAVAPGHLIVLTDEACFSSCLIFVDRLLRLGAVQAGQPTREGNWYMEVRAAPLPSGLGIFRTMQKVSLEFPRKMGPYTPSRPYPGDIADTAALERWLTAP